MKFLLNGLLIALVVLGALITTGCKSIYASHIQYIGGPKFPPTDPARVEILKTQPTRANAQLGEVRVEPSNTRIEATKIEDALRIEAAKLGADAVVVVYDKVQPTGAVYMGPWWSPSIDTIETRIVIAIAIKYQ